VTDATARFSVQRHLENPGTFDAHTS